ncbi:MAG: DNA-binding protein [Anaerolineae bacterium CG2_30_64_16]|nr:MAG: DNA-binding protein [Anaerolineae bacterium CG2_30_64_16]
MTADQLDLLRKAQNSLRAARVLLDNGYPDYAAPRAYFTMFYVAEAFLEGEGLAFSKHSAVIAAFGQHFIRIGRAPVEFHRFLLEAQQVRHAGDYGLLHSVKPDQARE